MKQVDHKLLFMAAKREAIAALLCAGYTPKEVSLNLKVPRQTIYKVKNCLDRQADPHPPPRKARTPAVRTPRMVGGIKDTSRQLQTNQYVALDWTSNLVPRETQTKRR
jgi:hypothetical protein